MAQNYFADDHPKKYNTLIRLPFQFILMWWAYQYTKPEAKPILSRKKAH